MHTLRTERLILRRWLPSDLLPFRALNADPRVMEFLPKLLSPEESDAFASRIEAHFEQHGFGLAAVDYAETATFIGYIGLSVCTFPPVESSVEIGWRLAADFWGRGLATEGARAILHYGFETLGLNEIISFTVPANLKSVRVMEKLGMTHDPASDFDHPRLPGGHPLRRHVLYRLTRPEFYAGLSAI